MDLPFCVGVGVVNGNIDRHVWHLHSGGFEEGFALNGETEDRIVDQPVIAALRKQDESRTLEWCSLCIFDT